MIYLDNSATSFPKPECVIREITDCMKQYCANAGRSGHDFASKTALKIFETRETIADTFNIDDPLQIVFTSNTTEALNIAIKGLLVPGDHAICTCMEHNSVLRPLHELKDVSYTVIPADKLGRVSVLDIEAAIRINTKMIICTHSSNVCGTIMPVEAIGNICKKRKILFLVDAAQSAGTLPIDVKKMKIDLLACPGHKGLLGPQGTGFLYVRNGIFPAPLICGGTGTDSSLLTQPGYFPEGYESGTLNAPGIIGLNAGIKFIKRNGMEYLSQYKHFLCSRLNDGLQNIPSVKIIGPSDVNINTSVISLTVEKKDCEVIADILNKNYGIGVRAGYHCAPLAHKALGTYGTGTVRISPGLFNTKEEIDRTIEAIQSISR